LDLQNGHFLHRNRAKQVVQMGSLHRPHRQKPTRSSCALFSKQIRHMPSAIQFCASPEMSAYRIEFTFKRALLFRSRHKSNRVSQVSRKTL